MAKGVAAFGRQLDAELFAYKASLFCEHVLGEKAGAAEIGVARAAFEHVATVAAEAPQRLAHRDFQSANLIVRPEREAQVLTIVESAA